MAQVGTMAEAARALVGREAPPETYPPVTREQIQRYCYAVDDLNPLYLDDEVAARGPYGGIIAPPLFFGVPSFRPLPLARFREDGLPTSEGDPPSPPASGAPSRLMGVDAALLRPIRPGDLLTRHSRLADVSEKQGRAGPLLFLVREVRVSNQREELVCVERSTTATLGEGASSGGDFRPDPPDLRLSATAGPSSPEPPSWEEVREGEELPAVVRRITPLQLLLFGAVKGNNHLIHYDRDYARREGLPERVAHGDLLWDFLCQLAVRWMGAAGSLRRFAAQNRGPAFVGEAIVHRGRVARKWREDDAGLVLLDLWSESAGGRLCLRGSATVALPREGQP